MKYAGLLILPFLSIPAYAQQQMWHFENTNGTQQICIESVIQGGTQKTCQPVNMHPLGTYDAELVQQPGDIATGTWLCRPGQPFDCYETAVNQESINQGFAAGEPNPEQEQQQEMMQQQQQQDMEEQQTEAALQPQGPASPQPANVPPMQTVWNFGNTMNQICHQNGNCFHVEHRTMSNYSMLPTDMNINGVNCRMISEAGPENTYFECYQ